MTNVGLEGSSNRSALSLQAYPSPFSRQAVSVTYDLAKPRDQVQLLVVNQQGQVISQKEQTHQQAGEHNQRLKSLSNAAPGTYFIRLIAEGEQQVERVVKVE